MQFTTVALLVSHVSVPPLTHLTGALIVYDVTDQDSFEKVKSWYVELKKYLEKDTPIIIAGNKADIVNKTVDEDEAKQYARSVGVMHMSTSAKSGLNVQETFTNLARCKCSSTL